MDSSTAFLSWYDPMRQTQKKNDIWCNVNSIPPHAYEAQAYHYKAIVVAYYAELM